jgi:two-component system chemotaxis response regulator CheY
MSADAAARRPVLLVEDDVGIAEGIRDLLEMEGYEVVWSQDGAEGLDVLRRLDPLPMLILLDLMMPRVDGFEFRARQRADARLAAIPVLVLTADPTPPDRLAQLDAAILRKPFGVDELLAAIRAATGAP